MQPRGWKTTGLVPVLAMFVACSSGTDERCSSAPGTTCIFAGTGTPGLNGDGHPLRESRLYSPIDLEFTPDGTAYVLDWNNHLVRRVTPAGTFETVIGDQYIIGDGAPMQADASADGAPGTSVSLNHPTDLQVHGSSLLLAAWHDHKLRTYDPDTGMVRVMAGSMPGFRGDGGPAARALFNQPKAIVYDADANLYVLDQRNQRIRKIDADGMISTVAGNGTSGLIGDGGAPEVAELSFQTGPNPQPSGALTVDALGRLYIGDGLNHCIRRVDFTQQRIERIAGTGEDGDFGDGGDPLEAKFGEVRDLEFGPDGRLYFADADHHVVRAIDLERHLIERVVGTGNAPMAGDARIEGRPALETPLHGPTGIAFDPDGQMYVADSGNHRIVKVWQ